MAHFLQFAAVFLAALVLTDAHGHGQGEGPGSEDMARGGRGMGFQQRNGAGSMERQRYNDDQGYGGQGARQQQGSAGGRQGGSDSRYTANIFNDDDVYGYDAKYPNGEAVFVNYRNTEARSRRGPDFARSNSISARSNFMSRRDQSQQGQQDGSYGRQQRNAMGMGMGSQQQGHPQ